MKAPSLAAIALPAAVLLAGCGSSSGTSTSATTATKTATAKTSATEAGGSSLKVTTTPKFATPPSSEPVLSGLVHVAYRNITINPDTLRVRVGTTVQWTDYDAVEHNVTSQGGPQRFASPNFGEGAAFKVKLTKPGVIHYECTLHPASMNGTIEVLR